MSFWPKVGQWLWNAVTETDSQPRAAGVRQYQLWYNGIPSGVVVEAETAVKAAALLFLRSPSAYRINVTVVATGEELVIDRVQGLLEPGEGLGEGVFAVGLGPGTESVPMKDLVLRRQKAMEQEVMAEHRERIRRIGPR